MAKPTTYHARAHTHAHHTQTHIPHARAHAHPFSHYGKELSEKGLRAQAACSREPIGAREERQQPRDFTQSPRVIATGT